MRFIIEKSGTYREHYYVVKFFEDGHRCGYVQVPAKHPFTGKNYTDIPVECHGGLTFKGQLSKPDDGTFYGTWIGFDCAHSGDRRDTGLAAEIFKDSEYINHTDWLGELFPNSDIRTLDYVEGECFSIIDQLIDAQKAATDSEQAEGRKE